MLATSRPSTLPTSRGARIAQSRLACRGISCISTVRAHRQLLFTPFKRAECILAAVPEESEGAPAPALADVLPALQIDETLGTEPGSKTHMLATEGDSIDSSCDSSRESDSDSDSDSSSSDEEELEGPGECDQDQVLDTAARKRLVQEVKEKKATEKMIKKKEKHAQKEQKEQKMQLKAQAKLAKKEENKHKQKQRAAADKMSSDSSESDSCSSSDTDPDM